jgi:hypothetical protein
MAIETWTPGNGAPSFTQIFSAGANLNGLANNSAVMDSTGNITNGTSLDIYADISVQLGAATSVSPAQLQVFLYPMNGDGVTFGDNQFVAGTQAAKTPAPQLYAGTISFPVATTTAMFGILERVVLPPGTFNWVIQNQSGVTLASSGNAVQWRSYNRMVA